MTTYTDVTFQVNDDHLRRFYNAIAGHFGYRELDENGDPNPETKAEYSRRKLRQTMILWVKQCECQAVIEDIITDEIDII